MGSLDRLPFRHANLLVQSNAGMQANGIEWWL